MASRIYTETDSFVNENGKLYVGKVFTAAGFRKWLRVQRRTRTIKWHVIHHTWAPESSEPDMGTVSKNIFDWYSDHWGFEWGRFCHTMTGTQQGQPVIFVGTHPDWQGIHCAYRNAYGLGTENYGNGQKRPFPDWQLELLWQVMLGYQEWAGVPTAYVGSSDAPGTSFHRDHPKAGKDCPGLPYNTAEYLWAKFAQLGEDDMTDEDRKLLEDLNRDHAAQSFRESIALAIMCGDWDGADALMAEAKEEGFTIKGYKRPPR